MKDNVAIFFLMLKIVLMSCLLILNGAELYVQFF